MSRSSRRGHRELWTLAMLAIGVLVVVSSCGGAGRSPSRAEMPTFTPKPGGTIVPGSVPYSGLPTLLPESVLTRVPTRVRVADLGIDLPVVAPPLGEPDHFPFCNVAEYLPALSRPGRPGTTFIYAHARAGMFLPILDASRVNGGRSLLGLEVEVFSSDALRFTYEVAEVRRHVVSLDFAYRATAEQLVVQTSEGPRETPEKLLLIALPRGQQPASFEASHPKAHPEICI
jgi:hypothetical protein